AADTPDADAPEPAASDNSDNTASGGRRPALSPSRASDFKQCPLLYRFRAIDRLPEPPTRAQARGTVVHSVLERLFELERADRDAAHARDFVQPAWQQLLTDQPE